MSNLAEKIETTFTITEYSETAAALEALRERMQGIIYDVATTTGMDMARKDRRELVTLRTSLEAKRKEIKAPALERCRLIDEEAKRITAELLALEVPIDQQIKAEEQRKADEKRQREEAEQKRQDMLKAKVTAIAAMPIKAVNMTAAEVKAYIENIEHNLPIGLDEYQEYLQSAINAKVETLQTLDDLLAAKMAAEEEAAKLREEAAKRESERLAEEERLAKEREQVERDREELRLLREKEEARLAEERRIEEEKLAELRRIEEERIANERAIIEQEQQKIDEQRKAEEAERRAEEERHAAEQRKKAEEEAEAERLRQEEAFAARLRTPYEAIRAILEVAEDKTITDKAARQRIIQAAKTALAGKE